MGFVIGDDATIDMLALLNKRFGPRGVGELVELQKEGKVYVVELVNVERRPEIDPQMAMFGGGGGNSRSDIERELTMGLHQYFQTLWFNFDDAKKRLGYASAEPAREEKESSNAPRAPLPSPLPM